ncbi:MAG: hypothetical protein R2751_18825 [Bacteroidales bacterium]
MPSIRPAWSSWRSTGGFGVERTHIIAPPEDRNRALAYRTDTESAILETISRRPCTLPDLHKILGLHVNEINKYLRVLEGRGASWRKKKTGACFTGRSRKIVYLSIAFENPGI